MENSDWLLQVSDSISQNENLLHKKDIAFYQFGKIEIIAKITNKHLDACEICNQNKNTVLDLMANAPEYLNKGISERRTFDQKLEEIKDHLRKKHQFYPNTYFSSLYTFLGMVCGILLAIALSYIFLNAFFRFFILVGFVIGTISGRIWGNIKDKKNRKLGKVI